MISCFVVPTLIVTTTIIEEEHPEGLTMVVVSEMI